MKNHTPGPWEWFTRPHGVYLATPHNGHLIVMDFVRRGMNGAEPRFATWKGDDRERMGGIMVGADDLENFADHPDAKLIAAAPEMLKALEATLSWLTNCNVNDPATLGRQIMAAMENAGYDKATLNDAAVALVRGPCSVPNMMGDDDE